MKRTLLSLVAVLAAAITFAQTELLTNGGFEKWTGGQPDGWKSASTASSATLSQSNEAHSGSFAVLVGGATSNKRLASAEMKLKAGTYTFSIYMKAETADGATARIGYVPIVDGKVGSYSYSSTEKGANAPDTISNEWFKKTFTFKLDVKATVCLVVMNSKNYASKNVIVDDASLTTEDGGLDDEGGGGGGGDDDPTAGAITISEAQAAASGTTCKVVGTVVAICKNGAVLGDDSGYIYYYKQSLSDLAIGDKVVLSGSTSEYGGFKQFTAAATVTKLGTETVTYPTPAELSLDAWLTQPAIQYVKLQGVLTISGNYYNLAVEGQEAVGSIVYPINSLTENLTSGSTVTVYGFVVYKSGSSTTYVNIVATKIDIDNMVVGKDIRNTPETAYTVTKARQLITEGEGLDYKVYVKGTVKGKPAIDTSFGNATYWIAGEAPTDGGKADTLEVYRGLYMNEEKFINEEALKEGDEVIVYGQLTDYQGTYEFTQGNFLYSINGATDKPQEKPVVTFADITIAEAAAWVVGKTSGIVYDNNKRLVL
ncbi:MAG: carbohydrate binding domain-containing protein, partial [Bacteroidaceae bacterium]|nr:carbohydrate binding domain-containing protein [Bacteroidaceae bacterium]